jgi:hypothetical protein
MQAVIERNITINSTYICAMRDSGATLRQIADKVGRTKERVRQILISSCGSTKHKLLSTSQLCKLTGLSKNRIIKFYQDNIISPVREWDTSTGHRSLWSTSAVKQVIIINSLAKYKTNRLCRICHSPVPFNRHYYCSERCYKESHKYKHRSIKARQRHLISMRRYKEKRKRLLQVAAVMD